MAPSYFSLATHPFWRGSETSLIANQPYSEKLEINPYIGKSDTNQNPHWVRVITGEGLIRVGFNISNQEGGLFVYPCLMNELGLKGVSLKCIALRFYVLLCFLDLGH